MILQYISGTRRTSCLLTSFDKTGVLFYYNILYLNIIIIIYYIIIIIIKTSWNLINKNLLKIKLIKIIKINLFNKNKFKNIDN